MGKLKKATDRERKQIQQQLNEEYIRHLVELEEMKIGLGDFVRVRTIYKDNKGKFLSREKVREMKRKKIPVQKEKTFYIKKDLPEFNLRKGDPIPSEIKDEVIDHLKEEVKYHNTIVGVMIHNDMTWNEAKEMVDHYFELYDRGEITDEELHDILSP